MLEALDQIESAGLSELKAVTGRDALESWRVKYLGTKGALKAVMPKLKDVPKGEKPKVGQRLNDVKAALEPAFDKKKAQVARDAASSEAGVSGGGDGGGPFIDVTEPGLQLGLGRRHIITRTIDEITEVFARMGFSVAYGPEVEDEWHNFTALNIPHHHPAREPTDNFYLDVRHQGTKARRYGESSDEATKRRSDEGSGASLLMLRSQTSTVQIRAMETSKPPMKVIAVGRVYRPDTHDATHYSMFHQVEGLYV